MNTIEQVKTQIAEVEEQIVNKQVEIESKQNEINSFEYECSDDEFSDYIDSIYPEVNIGSLSFNPSEIMKELDPTAYRCGKSDYESEYDLDDCEEYTDLKGDLENLESDLEDLESELEDLQDELDELESEED